MKKSAFPETIKKGNSVVKIYRHRNGDYEEYKVAYYADGRRKMETFADYQDARERADEINDSVNSGNSKVLTLTGNDRLAFTRAVEVLRPLDVPLELAAMQYAEAVGILGKVSLVEAARFYCRRHPVTLPDLTVTQAVDEFIAAKKEAGRSARHVADLTHRLGRIKAAFHCPIAAVSEVELRMFLGGLKSRGGKGLAPRSRNNFHSTMVCFFRWAVRKRYLPSDWNEFAAIETVEYAAGEIEIFTPEELAAILTHAGADEFKVLIPFLVIGAFAGLRSSEIARLDWKQIGIGGGKYIEVKAIDARKTKQRRLVPISANLAAWLATCRKAKGPVWPYFHTHIYRLLEQVAEKAGVKWKGNALRHSFCSYRMAEAQDAAKVSLEAGNSPQMIFSNYRELVVPEEAARWFSIKPDLSGQDKVIWLKAA